MRTDCFNEDARNLDINGTATVPPGILTIRLQKDINLQSEYGYLCMDTFIAASINMPIVPDSGRTQLAQSNAQLTL